MAQLVALMSGVVLGGVAEVLGSNLARGKIFTASIGSVDSLYPYIYMSNGPTQQLFYSDCYLIQYLIPLDKHSKRNLTSVSLTSEVCGLSVTVGRG